MQKKSIFKQYIIPIFGMTIFTVLTCVFIVLCIQQFKEGFVHKYAKSLLSTGLIVTILAYLAMVITLFMHVDAVHKSIFTLLVLAAIFLIGLYIMQRTGFYETVNSEEKLQAWLKSFGPWPSVIFILIQFLQVCLLPIPSTITVLAGVYMFGVWWSMLFSFIGIMLGSIVAFYIGRLLGYKVVAWIVGKEDLDKWLKKIKGKDKVLLTAMFLLPLFPDDVLCFVAGLTKMSPTFFIVMQVVSRGINTFVSCLLLKNISVQIKTWWGITIWSIVVIGIIIGMIYLWKYGEKIESWFMRKFTKKGKDTEQEQNLENKDTVVVDKKENQPTIILPVESTTINNINIDDESPPDKIE